MKRKCNSVFNAGMNEAQGFTKVINNSVDFITGEARKLGNINGAHKNRANGAAGVQNRV